MAQSKVEKVLSQARGKLDETERSAAELKVRLTTAQTEHDQQNRELEVLRGQRRAFMARRRDFSDVQEQLNVLQSQEIEQRDLLDGLRDAINADETALVDLREAVDAAQVAVLQERKTESAKSWNICAGEAARLLEQLHAVDALLGDYQHEVCKMPQLDALDQNSIGPIWRVIGCVPTFGLNGKPGKILWSAAGKRAEAAAAEAAVAARACPPMTASEKITSGGWTDVASQGTPKPTIL